MPPQELKSDTGPEPPSEEAAREAGFALLRRDYSGEADDTELGTVTPPAADDPPTVEYLEMLLAETNDELKFLRDRCVQFEVSSRVHDEEHDSG